MPPDRHSTEELVKYLRAVAAARSGGGDEVLLHDRYLEPRPPTFGILRPRLPDGLGKALQARGIRQLYTHQIQAIATVRDGRNVVVQTPTASGKTLCFALPSLERVLAQPEKRALYLYPTKALMADQLRNLEGLLGLLHSETSVFVGVLSGDVPRERRQTLQAAPPHLLLANPDILHHSVLPAHRRWQRLLANLDLVVLDELHTYRGAFGSHVALILRRLRRLAARYGANPTFVAASATIGNPVELAEQLVGLPFASVLGDGAGAFARRFLFWRPPLQGSAELNQHASTLREAAMLFVELLKAGRRVLLFGKSRTAVERMLQQARQELPVDLAARISAYKAGYTPEERQRIERCLRSGELLGVVTTNALELGIDIGALDAVVLAGYPGTVMSTWQQAGRVGRRDGEAAIIILVGGDDALDQYHLNHPQAFFGIPSEYAVVDPGNESILLGHLLCAAREAPLRADELGLFPDAAPGLVERLAEQGLLSRTPPWAYTGADSPHQQIAVRGVSRLQYQVLLDGRTLLATIEPPHLYREAHHGAVYLHNGRPYRVTEIDEAGRRVLVRGEAGEGWTDALADVYVAPSGDPAQTRAVVLGSLPSTTAIGPLVARETIAAYRETLLRRHSTRREIDPPHVSILDTVGLWIDFPEKLEASASSLHAVEHAMVNALPIVLLCDRRDVGAAHDRSAGPGGRVYLYDAYEGGIGLAEKAYLLLEQLVEGAVALLRDCRCADGCPSCLHRPGCALANDELDKAGALALLQGRPATAVARHPRRAERRVPAPDDDRPRLREIAHEAMRERLAKAGGVAVGDRVEWRDHGAAIVREIAADRARVEWPGARSSSWVPLRELRRADKA